MYRPRGSNQFDSSILVVGVAVLTLSLNAVVYFAERGLYAPETRRVSVLTWWSATAAMYAIYAIVLWVCNRDLVARKWRVVVFVVPVLTHLGWLFANPVLSIDLYSYLTDSFAARIGMNPYLHAPKEWAGTPLGAQLEQFGWRPTHSAAPYGPIWMLLMVGLGHAPFSVVGAAFAVKTLLSLCATGSAVLVWHILTLTRPGRRLFGLAAFTWNPLLVEITGEGHNDAVMVFAVLAAVWFVIRQRHRTGALALTVATLTKYVPVILAPAFLVFQARTAPNGSRLARQWMTTASVCAVAIALAFVPLWAGRHTFDGLQTGITLRVGPGTSGLLIAILSNVVDRYTAVITVGILVLTTFIIGSAAATRQVVDANTLVHACATICLLYVLVATPRLWPWYALLPCAMLCASGGTGEVWQAGVLSFCCRTIAPLSVLHQVNAIGWTDFVTVATAVGAGLPLLWWATASVSVQSLHRRQPV